MPLNRSSVLREDPAWIRQQLKSEHARIVPLWRNQNLFIRYQQSDMQSDAPHRPVACFIDKQRAEVMVRSSTVLIYLGHERNAPLHSPDGSPLFAVDLTHLEAHDVTQLISTAGINNADFLDLRTVGPMVAAGEAATMAYARGIAYWHRQNQYCGRCGNSTGSHRGGHMRRCLQEQCGHEIFPRIDPAVIMLVEQQQPDDGIRKCLLGRSRGLPTRVYSTLAGYVEIGESTEEAVAREVLEETALKVSQVTYLASQPWPFPANLMHGFFAQTQDRKITIAADELEDARWFSAAEIREFGEYEDASSHANQNFIALPRKDSIARTLIETWLNGNS